MSRTHIATNIPTESLPIKISTEVTRKYGDFHMHSHTQMSYVLTGTMKHVVDSEEYMQTPGSCMIIPAYTPHTINTLESDDTPGVVFITFHDNFLTDRGHRYFSCMSSSVRFEEYTLPIFSELSGNDKEKADEIIREMRREFDKKKEMSFDRIADLLCDFFRILCIEVDKDADIILVEERANAVTHAVNYIENNYEKKITIDELCSMAAMSRCLFTRNFKAITGTTVAKFILSVRLQHARTAILFTEKSLDEIAKEVGLYDKAHLSRAFLNETGMTTSEYRKKNRPLTIDEHIAFLRRWEWLKK